MNSSSDRKHSGSLTSLSSIKQPRVARLRATRGLRSEGFPARRGGFISRLARAGVSPAISKELARHSTITLTIDYYTHVQDEQRAALAKLPPVA